VRASLIVRDHLRRKFIAAVSGRDVIEARLLF
jgi:hypothetical protein